MRERTVDQRVRKHLRRRGRDDQWRRTFAQRKAARAEYYFRWQCGWRQRPCTACAGSGRYDNDGSPPCGGCEGTGRETYRGPKVPPAKND